MISRVCFEGLRSRPYQLKIQNDQCKMRIHKVHLDVLHKNYQGIKNYFLLEASWPYIKKSGIIDGCDSISMANYIKEHVN